MSIKRIDDMDKWLVLKAAIIEKGYKLWQMQYDSSHEEGFHIWLIKGDKQVEVVTHNRAIEMDIVNSHL